MSMSKPPSDVVKNLVATLDEAVDLLEDFSSGNRAEAAREQDLGSLVEQCMALCAAPQLRNTEPVRIVHHFACTGGTVLCKCIAAMPNTQLLSEVNPLSTLNQVPGKPVFAPTDMIRQMRQSTRGVQPSVLIDLFLNDLDVIYDETLKQGCRLVLRDHSHSHYCSGAAISDEPHLAAMVAQRHEVVSIVTVRDPVETFLSLKTHKWDQHFKPGTFDEYCRRYLRFLDDHRDVRVFKYEEFVRDPQAVMLDICSCLQLPFSDQFESLFGVFNLTGDSGRKSSHIGVRESRPLAPEMASEIEASAYYPELRKQLGYV